MVGDPSQEPFAKDGNVAEKAQASGAGPEQRGGPCGQNVLPVQRTVNTLTTQDLYIRQDAKIWRLYLEDAEREAKERAELWRTGLDSLLIFAGLFAGIVSSFVIDARKDIQMDSEQRSLSKITSIMTHSDSTSQSITPSARWTSALWILSLYITLFGTIMGVLARSWLTKFVPATTRREAQDAYERYRLDRQAEQWFLKEVFTLVPLLVQIAAFLFLAGLVLQTRGDDPTIGYLLLAGCISGGLIYLAITAMHLMNVPSPFDTPLSELLLRFRTLATSPLGVRTSSNAPKDKDSILADIVYNHLLFSANPTHVDEAIAEIPGFSNKWIQYLSKGETPGILLSRMSHSSASTVKHQARILREETISNSMLALLKLIDNYEAQILSQAEGAQALHEYSPLHNALHDSLGAQKILNRYNTLPERLRPLLFVLRTRVIIFLQHEKLFKPRIPPLLDFEDDEIPELPWELALQEVPPSYRMRFILATCRGLIKGRRNIRLASAFTLGITLAKRASDAQHTGRSSDWTGDISTITRQEFTQLASDYLTILYKEIALHWESAVIEALAHEAAVHSQIPGDEDPVRAVTEVNVFKSIITIKNITLGGIAEDQHIALKLLVKLARVHHAWKAHAQNVLVEAIKDEIEQATKYCSGKSEWDSMALKARLTPAKNCLAVIKDLCFPERITIGREYYTAEGRASVRREFEALGVLDEYESRGLLVHKAFTTHFLSEKDELPSASLLVSLEHYLDLDDDDNETPRTSPTTFPWDFLETDLLVSSMPKRIVRASLEGSGSVYACARRLLGTLIRNGRLDVISELIPERLLDNYGGDPVSRHNVALLLESVLDDVHPFEPSILASAVRMASKYEEDRCLDKESRISWMNTVLKICRSGIARDKVIHCVKEAMVDVKDAIKKDPEPEMQILWITLLDVTLRKGKMLLPAPPIHIVLHFYMEAREQDTIETVMQFFDAEHFPHCEEYYAALEIVVKGGIDASKEEPTQLLQPESIRWSRLVIQLLRHPALPPNLQHLCHEGFTRIEGATQAAFAARNGRTAHNEHHEFPQHSVCNSETDAAKVVLLAELGLTIADYAPEKYFSYVDDVLQLARGDLDLNVRLQCLRLCQRLVRREKLHEIFVGRMRAIADDEELKVRLIWSRILGQLGSHVNGHYSQTVIAQLGKMAIADGDASVREQAIYSLNFIVEKGNANSYTRYGPIWQVIVEYLEMGKENETGEVRQAWFALAASCLGNVNTTNEWFPSIQVVISQLAHMSVRDADASARSAAFNCLNNVLTKSSQARDCVKQCLSETLRASIHHADRPIRFNAVRLISSMMTPMPYAGTSKEAELGQLLDSHSDIVAPCIPSLLKMNHIPTEEEFDIRDAVAEIMLQQLTAFPPESKMIRLVLTCIPPAVEQHTLTVQAFVTRIIIAVQPSLPTATLVTSALASIFANDSQPSFTRASALRLFSQLSSKCRIDGDHLPQFEYAIPSVTSLALDNRYGEGELRISALELLAELSTDFATPFDQRLSHFGRHLVHVPEQLMTLLGNEMLHDSVLKLLSLRRKINLAIMSNGLTSEGLVIAPAHVELLCRMVYDGRFNLYEPTDYAMILHMSSILDHPQFVRFQPRFYASLWSRHGSGFVVNGVLEGVSPPYTIPGLMWHHKEGPTFDVMPDRRTILIDWFRYALFGRHTTAIEIETWLHHCKEWLPAEYLEKKAPTVHGRVAQQDGQSGVDELRENDSVAVQCNP
ncbi:hypothetical protein NMY22_g10616 [Coprinellus aureogranulatus]|nr:hypothetical protein NMY22_g10616 [Coprinellus aureogranulatus]